MKHYLNGILRLTAILMLAACDNSDKVPLQDISDTASATTNNRPFNENGEVKLYTLPAPLQVSTLLYTSKIPFNSNILIPVKPSKTYTNNLSKALNLGLYVIDLGYTATYEQKQSSLNYLKASTNLMDELGVSSGIQKDMVQRFEKNIGQSDSLSKIILEGYNKAHDYFKTNKRDDIGLFILTGSFIEGLHLSLANIGWMTKKEKENIVGQQKLYFENIVELLQYHDTPEVDKLVDLLVPLYQEYHFVQVETDNKKTIEIVSCKYSSEQLAAITEKCKEIRSMILEKMD